MRAATHNTLHHGLNTHCNTLQYTATHCNTLQHILQHTLQHTATHCNTLQHTATHCNTLQHTISTVSTHTATHRHTHILGQCHSQFHLIRDGHIPLVRGKKTYTVPRNLHGLTARRGQLLGEHQLRNEASDGPYTAKTLRTTI